MDDESFFFFAVTDGVLNKEPQETPDTLLAPEGVEHWCKDYLYLKAPDLSTAQVKAENLAHFLSLAYEASEK